MKIFSLLFILIIFAKPNIFASEFLKTVRISSSPNPLGSGARALGFGNAFIAVADDATAASWNPGGLIQLEKSETSLVWYYSHRSEDYSDSSEINKMATNDLNYFSIAWPFHSLKTNMVISLNYQRLYDLNKKIVQDQQKADIQIITNDKGETINEIPLNLTYHIDYQAEGGIKALSPAYAIQIKENLSFGFTLNFFNDVLGDQNGWTSTYEHKINGTYGKTTANIHKIIIDEYNNLRGFSYNLGGMWEILEDKIKIGAVYKSSLNAKLDYMHSEENLNTDSTASPPFISSESMELIFPSSYGLGIYYQRSKRLKIAFDMYRTDWSNYLFINSKGKKISPINGRDEQDSNISSITQFHLGSEYLIKRKNTIIPLRGGIFMEPEPSENSQEKYYGMAIGLGLSFKKIVIDMTYQYRFGFDVAGNTIGIPETNADVRQHRVYLSTVWYL